MASLDGLRADLAPPAPEPPAAGLPGTSPETTPAAAPAAERRSVRRSVRRVRRVQADASDGFRRARRVGQDRL